MEKTPAQKLLINAGAIFSGICAGLLVLIVHQFMGRGHDGRVYWMYGILAGWLVITGLCIGLRPMAMLLAFALATIGVCLLIYDDLSFTFGWDPVQVQAKFASEFLPQCPPTELRFAFYDARSGERVWKLDLTSGIMEEEYDRSKWQYPTGERRLTGEQLGKIKSAFAALQPSDWRFRTFLIGYPYQDETHVALYQGGFLHLYDYPSDQMQPKQLLQEIKAAIGPF